MTTVYLVGCGKAKHKTSSKIEARDYYRSQLFTKTRAHVEGLIQREGGVWFVLSARYGLLNPSDKIAPYDLDLATLTPVQKIRWVRQVALALRIRDGFKTDTYVAFAGATYIDPLARELAHDGIRIKQPLRGKQIGQRLQWLKERA